MKITLLSLLFCSIAHGAACPSRQMKDQAALIQIEQVWLKADGMHDTVTLGCILADEFEEADFDGSLIDRATMLTSAMKPGNSSIHFELSDLHVHLYGDTAYVRGIGVGSENGRPVRKNRFTDIFVYRDGRWQCVAGHQSHFPELR